VALGAVLVLAAALRLAYPTYVEYFHDDAMLVTLAQEMARDGRLPLTGILSSTGIPNSPASVYGIVLPFLLTPDPTYAVLYVMILNVIGVGCLYTLLRQTAPPFVAVTGAALYAVSPWAVWYSRKIWAQDFHTPFLLLSLTLLVYGLKTRHRWLQGLALPVGVFAMQIHFAAWALLPVYLLLLFAERRRLSRRALIVGLLLSAAALVPYAAGLLRTLEADPTRISDALQRASGSTQAAPLGLALMQMLTLASGVIDVGTANRAAPPPLSTWLYGLPYLLLTLWGALRVAQQRHPLRWALLWWAFGPALLLLIPATPSYIHYYVASLPALAVLSACGVSALFKAPRPVRMALYSVLLLLPVGSWATTLVTISNQPFNYPDFTTPLAYLLPVRDALAQSTEVVVISDGMAWDLKHDVAVWHTLLRERVGCVRTLRDGFRIYPQAGSFSALIAPDGRSSRSAAELLAAAEGGFVLTARQIEVFTVLHVPAQPAPLPAHAVSEAYWLNGAAFIGLDTQAEQITLYWRIVHPQGRDADYQYTVQAYAADGTPLGQHDGRFLHGIHWCRGDLVLIDVPLHLHPQTAELRVGLYQLGPRHGEYTNIAWIDADGHVHESLVSVVLD
jgi:hypothetical protein